MLKTAEKSVELLDEFTIDWIEPNVGFGKFKFYSKDGMIYCDNETMSKEFIKSVLTNMVDKCILTD